jgi:hypothetical protein
MAPPAGLNGKGGQQEEIWIGNGDNEILKRETRLHIGIILAK